MSKVDKLINKYAKINEVAFDPSTWGRVKNAAKTAGGHALDIATGGISSAVTDTIDAARGKDTGSQVDALQGQVDQQAQDADFERPPFVSTLEPEDEPSMFSV